MSLTKNIFLITALLVSFYAVADTKKYTGVIYVTSNKSLMPMANGDGVSLVNASGIATLSTTPPALLKVKCAGMGTVDKNGEANTDFYCSFLESLEQGFDVKGVVNGELGSFDIIGGNGKWAKATGKGQFIQAVKTAEGSKNMFEMQITTP